MIKLRRFSLSDLPRILELERASFPIDPFSATTFRHYYLLYPAGFFVAECEGNIVGYIVGHTTQNCGQIDSIAVEKKHQRRGIGKKLSIILLDQFRKDKISLVELEVRLGNQAAISLYQALGFVIIKTIKNYYSDGTDAYIMRKHL